MRQLVFPLFLFLFCACAGDGTGTEAKQDRPNILFIFTDDHAYDAVGALGNPQVITPNLDRLVRSGTTFTHTYNMGGWNGAICVASRAMLNSGRSIFRAHELTHRWNAGEAPVMNQNWGPLMADAGYATYMTGKWHVDAPAEQQFGTARHVRPGMPADGFPFPQVTALKGRHGGVPPRDSLTAIYPPGYNRPLSEDDATWSPTDTTFGGFWAGGRHWSEVVADDAEAFLEDAAGQAPPFFMYLAFNAPHDPRQAPREFQDLYDVDEITVPPSFLPEYPYAVDVGGGRGLRDEELAPFPRTELAVRTHLKEYYASISHLDAQVGRILDALERSGKADNTVILFTADHGLAVGRHGFLGKQNLYDHSVRVPLVVAGPGITAGATVARDVYLQDVMPTALELAGAPVPDYVEFQSLLGLLDGDPGTPPPYPAIFGAYVDLQRSIRKDGHKLIVYPKIGVQRLYDLEADPREMNDIIAERPDLAAELLTDLQDLQEHFRDTLRLTD